jgi:fimbrial chaperone protein
VAVCTPRVKRATLLAVVLGLGLFQAEAAFGSAFKVTPIRVVLWGERSSALLTLTNESDQTLRFQITAFAWDQSSTGEMQLAPTEDIVFFPTLLSLDPGKERKVRVGTLVPSGATEKTYRIFFEELPPLERTATNRPPTQIRVLTKMGVPVFLEPEEPFPAGGIENLSLENGSLRFRVRNSGNVHFSLQAVRVKGTGASGETVAGGIRDYELPSSHEECTRVRWVTIEAQTERSSFEAQEIVRAGACVPQ